MNLFSKIFVFGAALAVSAMAQASHTIRCESNGDHYRECRVGGELDHVELEEQLSNAPCVGNVTWGAEYHGDDFIWVNYGCRAKFRVWLKDDRNDDQDQE